MAGKGNESIKPAFFGKAIMSRRLYVGNLSQEVDERTLRATFSEHGAVDDVKIVVCAQTKESVGYGFVEMSSPSDAARVVGALNGTEIAGQVVKVEEARGQRPRNTGTKRSGRR